MTGLHHLERKRPIPYVNHYSFHILDRDGGHLTIKISGHPPFPAQVILNGHEWVACQVRKAGIQFRKEGAHRQDHPGLSAPAALPAPAREERTDMGRHRRETCDDLTIFKLHCGRVTLKIYTKGERVLRIEAVAHKTQALGRRALAAFPSLVAELNAILERFVDALACIDHCFIGGEILDALPLPSEVGHTKVGGIDLNKPRMQWVATAVLALALTPRGFTASDLARQVQRLGRSAASAYAPRSAAYDLKTLRGKHLVHRIEGTRRDAATVTGLRTLATVTVLRTQIIRPLLAAAELTPSANAAPQATPLDRHYEALRAGMHGVFHELGIAA